MNAVLKDPIDAPKLEALLGKMVDELGAAANGALIILGEKLGLFRALASGGPATPAELARRTRTHERYVREWLSTQAASGFVAYDAASGEFALTPEQAAVFADDESPFFMAGGTQLLSAVYAGEPRLTEAFRTGEGIPWGAHCTCLFCGTDKLFRPGYRAYLVNEWIPALGGVRERLEAGASVADVGCGHGSSTIILAQAFPKSRFAGFDFHESSIEHARGHANGLPNVSFEVARADQYRGQYDVIAMFDSLHDMGDPVGVLRHARESLVPGGCVMLVEPMSGDRLEDNLNPMGRASYAFSTSLCVPGALSQPGGMALGAQAGEPRLREVAIEAGFRSLRRVAETPNNMVLEARV